MKTQLEDILYKVQQGTLSPKKALELLKDYPYQDLAFAKIDHYRELRRGFPEIIFGHGKTPDQIVKISREILKKGNSLLITKVDPSVYRKIKGKLPDVQFNAQAKVIYSKQKSPAKGKGKISIITAGTSDIPVAEEAAITCEIFGNDVERIYDVGVAGLHRLFGEYDKITGARVIIAIAGMEGALPSVIAGITDKPIIAVPTSVGYGASLKGLAALLAMLNSCPGGVAVVNIDNGFGAAYLASIINHL
ncbi:MAG: nickel pincer cofactor biosynthesis protein LarB [Candidatus Aminicenantes bacterium]|nr:nickel pincer cofactor biosynthesis protein LarB [Candidatus Aminicenantes bacterium]MDH5385764.1 nickel pincer cofactor biosynthesis protein LarB [Candidatus Aminicenantes bacterium]